MSESALLEVRNLCRSFSVSGGMFSRATARLHAVNDVSFSLYSGETLGLVGESGCGKSTLARLLLCLDMPDSGAVLYAGANIYTLRGTSLKAFRRRVQIVFQDPFSSLNPRKKVGSIIGEPMLIHKLATRKDVAGRVHALMAKVGLRPDHYDRFPHEFSSGQRQRIGIARALSLNPDLIIADEPVSALDVSIQAQTLNLFMDLQQELGLTYLFISHDLSVVRFVSSRVAVMYLGAIVEIAPSGDLYNHPVHPYTESLLSAVPFPDPERAPNRVMLQGDVPTPFAPPRGCPFSSRCPIADRTVCFDRPPGLEEKRPGHFAACYLRS